MTRTELEELVEQEFVKDQQELWEQWERTHNPDETFTDRWDEADEY